MLSSYFKLALKVLRRRPFFTATSLFGIAFTLTTLLVVSAIVSDYLAPRAPEVNLGRTLHLSRLFLKGGKPGDEYEFGTSPGYGLLDRHARGLPGVQIMSIVSCQGQPGVSFVDGRKVESRLRWTDRAYWDILSFTFLEGGPFAQEAEEGGDFVAVISEATRRRLIHGRTALNERVVFNGVAYRVVGVVKNVSATRLSAAADVWLPDWTHPDADYRRGMMNSCMALLLLDRHVDTSAIKSEFRSRLEHVSFDGFADLRSVAAPLQNRFDQVASRIAAIRENGDYSASSALRRMFGLVALFLLLPTVSLVSINLSRILERAPEIGVRKAFGADSGQLVGQFVFENILLCLLGALLALLATAALLAAINAGGFLLHSALQVDLTVFGCAVFYAVLLGLLSGALPAWRMARMAPVEALRGGLR